MKLELDRSSEVDRIGKNVITLDYMIDPENVWMAIKLFYNYSDAISSFVREIASNCVDSHIEASLIPTLSNEVLTKHKQYDEKIIDHLRNKFSTWKNRPIEIELYTTGFDKQDTYIKFRDFGVGLSKDRIIHIYSKFLSSTKRHSNGEIGAYGLGSKSPLGYTDSFNVVSIFEGRELSITIHESNKGPQLEILYERETNEENGTTVIVPIENNHIEQVKKSVKEQLAYFDNIIYIGFDNISDDYEIYEGDNFLYRSDSLFRKVHLSHGKVYYPINFTAISELYKLENLPIALKLDIGSIDIIWNREAVEYSDRTKTAILNKVKLLKEELKGINEKRNNEITSLSRYIKEIKNNGGIYTKNIKLIKISDKVSIPNVSWLDLKVSYKKYEEVGIPDNIFFTWGKYSEVCFGLKSRDKTSINSVLLGKTNYKIFRIEGNMSSIKNKYIYDKLKIDEFILIKRTTIGNEFYKERYTTVPLNVKLKEGSPSKEELIEQINKLSKFDPSSDELEVENINYINVHVEIITGKYTSSLVKRVTTIDELESVLNQTKEVENYDVTNDFNNVLSHFNYGIKEKKHISLIKEYIEELDELIYKFIPSYDDIEISEEWIKEYRRIERENKKSLKKSRYKITDGEEELISIKSIYYNTTTYDFAFEKDKIKLSNCVNYTGLTIYGFREHDEILKRSSIIVFSNPNYIIDDSFEDRITLNHKKCRILKIGKTNEKYFKENENTIFIMDFLEGKGKENIIIRHMTAKLMSESLPKGFEILSHENMRLVDPRIAKFVDLINKYIAQYYIVKSVGGYRSYNYNRYKDDHHLEASVKVEEGMYQLFMKNKLWDEYMLNIFLIVKQYLNVYPLLKNIKFEDCDVEEIKIYIKAKKGSDKINPHLLYRFSKKKSHNHQKPKLKKQNEQKN